MTMESGSLPAEAGNVEEDEISLLDLLIVLAKHKKRIIGITLLGIVLSVAASLSMTNIYTSTTRILPPQQSSSGAAALLAQLGGLAGAAGGLAGIKNPNDLYVAMLKSRTLLDAMVVRFDLVKKFEASGPAKARNALEGMSTISAGKDGIISIDVDHSEPEFAAQLANAYVEELRKLNQDLAVTEAAQRRLFFEGHLKAAKEKLAAAETAMRELQEKSGLLVLDQQSRASIESVAALRAQIGAKEVQIQSMRLFATTNNPDLKFAEQELAGLRTQLEKLRANEPGDVLIPASKIPGQGLEYVRRLREVKYAETIFEVLAKQYELARIEEGKNASLIQVLDRAVPAEWKSKPRRSIIVILSTLAAFFLAVLSAFVSEAMGRARRDPRQAERLGELRRLLRP